MVASRVTVGVVAALGTPILGLKKPADTSRTDVDYVVKHQKEYCTCMNWKQAYESDGADCGEANEYIVTHGYNGTKKMVPRVVAHMMFGHDYCDRFFTRQDHNYCMKSGVDLAYRSQIQHFEKYNASLGSFGGKEWCWISPGCVDMNGGTDVSSLAWKVCKDSDKHLGDLKPEQLAQMALKQDVNLELLIRSAYTVWKEGELWSDVSAMYGLNATGHKLERNSPLLNMNKAKPSMSRIQQLIKSKATAIFDTKVGGHPPFFVVSGKKVWWLHGHEPKDIVESRPSTYKRLTCVAGC